MGPSEQVAALIANSARFTSGGEADPYAISIIAKVAKSTPLVLHEMLGGSRRTMRLRRLEVIAGTKLGAFTIGPETNRHMQAFGTKLACALHYWESGNIVPASGGIFVQWWTNVDRIEGDILPSSIWKILGSPNALTQGKKTSYGQFEYASAIGEDGTVGAYFSSFGKSFATLGIVSQKRKIFECIASRGARIYVPGSFIDSEARSYLGTIGCSFTCPIVPPQRATHSPSP